MVRDTSSGFTKISTVIRLSGGGHAGEGEDSHGIRSTRSSSFGAAVS